MPPSPSDFAGAARYVALLALMALTGCTNREYGPEQTEPARVADLPYVPSGHGSGTGIGIGSKGVVPTMTTVDIPARYAIVFECQHGRLVVERHPEIWKTLRVGQQVTVRFREVFEVSGESRHLVDLDFLGVDP